MVQTAITPYNDYYIQGTEISGSHFPLGAAFVLILLTFGINPFIKKAMPISGGLTPGELITIWIMLLVSSAIPSKGMMGFLIPFLVAPLYLAKPENEWKEVLHPHLPEWLVV